MVIFDPKELKRPKTLEESLQILTESEGKARLVAGNTTLYDLAQHGGLDDVDILVDISGLDLNFIREKASGSVLEVGASTTFSDIERCKVRSRAKGLDALFETAAMITPPQVRNMATIGGSLCAGNPFLDMPPTLLSLNAILNVASKHGERRVKVEDHFVDYFQTSVQANEMVTSVELPFSSENSGSAFIKLGRTSVDFAAVNVASFLNLDERRKCVEARISLGAVANIPIRWRSVEEKLLDNKLDKDWIIQTMNRMNVDLEPSPTPGVTSEYKKLVIPKLARDSILAAFIRATRTMDEKAAQNTKI